MWILNNGLANFGTNTLANGSTYYFRARGVQTLPQTGGSPVISKTAWSAVSGPVTIGAPASTGSTSTVSGQVTLPTSNATSGAQITLSGPLYVGFYDEGTGKVYADRIVSPSSPQNYSVNLPNSSTSTHLPNYVFFAILDQNNNGLIDAGDISNVNGVYSQPVAISSTSSFLNSFDYDFTAGYTAGSSTPVVTTQLTQATDINNITTINYGLNLQVFEGMELPVAAELTGPFPDASVDASAYLIAPVDFAACTNCDNLQLDYQTSVPGTASVLPQTFDTASVQVTYSGNTPAETVDVLTSGAGATAWNNGASYMVSACGLDAAGTIATGISFNWVDLGSPSSNQCGAYSSYASDFTYSFTLSDSKGNVVWQIPASNSPESAFDYTITSIAWGSDPTGNTGNTPTVTSLTSGAVYTWAVQVVDSDGNSSITQQSFTAQ
jgi:hypothetical protein